MNSQPAFPGLCSIIVELFYAWQPFWVDRTESRLYNNITTVVITTVKLVLITDCIVTPLCYINPKWLPSIKQFTESRGYCRKV